MRTRLFDWAKSQGLSMEDLSSMTGYSARHLHRIKSGEYPLTRRFAAQVVFNMGDWARSLFFPDMPHGSVMAPESTGTSSRIPAEPAPVRSESGSSPSETSDTTEAENVAESANSREVK